MIIPRPYWLSRWVDYSFASGSGESGSGSLGSGGSSPGGSNSGSGSGSSSTTERLFSATLQGLLNYSELARYKNGNDAVEYIQFKSDSKQDISAFLYAEGDSDDAYFREKLLRLCKRSFRLS